MCRRFFFFGVGSKGKFFRFSFVIFSNFLFLFVETCLFFVVMFLYYFYCFLLFFVFFFFFFYFFFFSFFLLCYVDIRFFFCMCWLLWYLSSCCSTWVLIIFR